MKSKERKGADVKGRGSILRAILIVLSLVPVWHLMGRAPFNLSASDPAGGRVLQKARVLPYPSDPISFTATAYCENGLTKSGEPAGAGIVAADPHVLPIGSWIKIDGVSYSGIYQVMDTGRLVREKRIDIYLPTLSKAVNFGIRKVTVTVLKYGAIRHPPRGLSS